MAARTQNDAEDRQRLVRALGQVHWKHSEDAAPPAIATGLSAASITLVKRGDCRAIYRVDAPHGAVYVKHRWTRGWLAKCVDWLRGSASRREFQQSQEAARRGVPTTQSLAYGEINGPGVRDALLVTRELCDAEPLDQFIAINVARLQIDVAARHELIAGLATLCAKSHDAGLEHDDLHAGNILVVWPATQPRPALHLIDLDKARLGAPLSRRRSRRNLAMLLCGLHHVATPRDMLRFWRGYRRARPAFQVNRRQEAAQIWRRGMRRVQRVLRDRDQRSLRTNRQFAALRTGSGVALCVKEWATDSLRTLLNSPDTVMSQPGAQALKLSFGSVVIKTTTPAETQPIVFKRIRAKAWTKRLLAPIRPSRARIAWFRGHALLARGIATARPLFMLEPRWRTLQGESYLATEWIDGATNLHLFLWDLAKRPPGEQRTAIQSSARALGALLGKMHGYGVSHRDLKGCNLAVAENGSGRQWYLLDLEGVRLGRNLKLAERASNLARLAVSAEIHPCLTRTDRLRFLRAYCQSTLVRDDWKTLWRLIARDCRQELARLKRNGSIVA